MVGDERTRAAFWMTRVLAQERAWLLEEAETRKVSEAIWSRAAWWRREMLGTWPKEKRGRGFILTGIGRKEKWIGGEGVMKKDGGRQGRRYCGG